MIATRSGSGPSIGEGRRASARSGSRMAWSLAWELSEVRWAVLAAGLFAVGSVFTAVGASAWATVSVLVAAGLAGGWAPALEGVQAFRDRRLDVDLLMVVAAIVAFAIGQEFDGALLIVIFSTSGALESFATSRTAASVRSLLDLAPDEATRVGAHGGEARVAAAELLVGDRVLVRPGERIPADGTVVDGSSEVDQASITGEAVPAFKSMGDEVFAGTVVGTGALWIGVSRPASESMVARIAALVDEASETKANTQLFVERIEQRYSIAVVIATLALFLVPLAFGHDLRATLLRAMTFMIVASPCAVVLATMPPLLSAIANAGRHGVLVKSSVVMERLATVTVVAFDKTGTLTRGTPRVSAIYSVSPLDADQVLTAAARAEHPSEHPVARAIVAAALDAGIATAGGTQFSSTAGWGVTSRIGDQMITVSNPSVLGTLTQRTPADLLDRITELEAEGATTVVVTIDGSAVGVIGLSDEPRGDARHAVERLTALTSTPPVLLSGDNANAAGRLGRSAGISDVRAALSPVDKVDEVRRMQAAGEHVLFIGDGVNDAPAMATADVSIAMGQTGADLAIDTADAITIRDELTPITALVGIAFRARRYVTANLIIAGTIITALVIWNLAGHLPLPLGVAGHEGSTVIVGLNGLRLLRRSAWH